MKRVLMAAGFVALCAASASADTIAVLTRNTLTLTDEAGGVTTVLLNADKSLGQIDPVGMGAAGFWSLDNARLCMTARGKAQICFTLPADKQVGETFNLTGPTGKMSWTAAIVEGRADLGKLAEGARAAREAATAQ
jgi:hypothetical protein